MSYRPTPSAGVRTLGVLSRVLSRLTSRAAGNPSREGVPQYTPERLANVLIRQVEAAFLVIPAATSSAGKNAPDLLRKTCDVLQKEGGFATRIGLLKLFADLAGEQSDEQSVESFSALYNFVMTNEALLATFRAEEKALDALEALDAIHDLPQPGRGTAMNSRPKNGARGEGLSAEETRLRDEWRALKNAVRKLASQKRDQRARTIEKAFRSAPDLSILRRPLQKLALACQPLEEQTLKRSKGKPPRGSRKNASQSR